MRILHVFKDYYPPTAGGVERHIHDITHSLKGYQFAVLTSSRSRQRVVEDDDGVRVVRTPELFRPMSTPITPAWVKAIRNSGAELFHFHMPNPFGELAFLRSKAPAPMIAGYHADIVGRRAALPLFKPFQHRFLKRARHIVVGSARFAETSMTLRRHLRKVSIIPYGIEAAEWAERPALADELKERYPGPVVMFLGRLAYYKGLDILIQAMRQIDATCLIVGDGPKRPELEALTASLHLRHKVFFLGGVNDAMRRAYYHLTDVFVLPSTSRAESFGISMLEAMACGTPAVSTEIGTGTSWVNIHNETGLVVPPNSPEALGGALRYLLGDRLRAEEMGYAAADRVRQNFTRYQMLEAFASLYASV